MADRKAVVIRGVYIRGKAHGEGATGSVRNDGVVQPGDDFVLTHQQFDELRASNYVAAAPGASPPVTPSVAPAPPIKPLMTSDMAPSKKA